MLVVQKDIRKLVEHKRVAVVGNAPELLDLDYGRLIDGHDLVLRINRAVPSTEEQRMAIGERTDILTGGVLAPLYDLPIPKAVLWLKHTRLGNQHLNEVLDYKPFEQALIWHVPLGLCEAANRAVGHSASSSIVILHALQTLDPAEVSVFGVSCWGCLEPGAKRHWWQYGKGYEALDAASLHWHDAQREAAWYRNHTEERGRLWRVAC